MYSIYYSLLVDWPSEQWTLWRTSTESVENKKRCIYHFLPWELCWYLISTVASVGVFLKNEIIVWLISKRVYTVQNGYLSLILGDLTKWWRSLLDALKSLPVWCNNKWWHCWASGLKKSQDFSWLICYLIILPSFARVYHGKFHSTVCMLHRMMWIWIKEHNMQTYKCMCTLSFLLYARLNCSTSRRRRSSPFLGNCLQRKERNFSKPYLCYGLAIVYNSSNHSSHTVFYTKSCNLT